jgi:hypothetical protein
MKLDWKKEEKIYYLPKEKPELVDVPEFKYFTIGGKGNPNDPSFAEYISILYSLSYAIKMSPRQNCAPPDYVEYTVYPLEGVWDLTEKGKNEYGGTIDKSELLFILMIRQPDFVTENYARETIERTKKKKPNRLLEEVRFERILEGRCIQMLHAGSYDDEPASFKLMEEYARGLHLERAGRQHKEIYLSDPGRVEKDKLKTVLRFKVQQRHSTQ